MKVNINATIEIDLNVIYGFIEDQDMRLLKTKKEITTVVRNIVKQFAKISLIGMTETDTIEVYIVDELKKKNLIGY